MLGSGYRREDTGFLNLRTGMCSSQAGGGVAVQRTHNSDRHGGMPLPVVDF